MRGASANHTVRVFHCAYEDSWPGKEIGSLGFVSTQSDPNGIKLRLMRSGRGRPRSMRVGARAAPPAAQNALNLMPFQSAPGPFLVAITIE
jgi:hypothetical protein